MGTLPETPSVPSRLSPKGLLVIGPSRDGQLLEVVVVDGSTIIHAMQARPKFFR